MFSETTNSADGKARREQQLSNGARYLQLLERFSVCAEAANLDVQTHDPARIHFLLLPPAMQARILAHLQPYVEVCEEMIWRRESLLNDKQFLWRMLVKLRLKPSADLMDRVREGDIVEIYDMTDWVQVFRSVSFYKVCSYTLDDVMSRPWFELYKRDSSVTEQLLATGESLRDPNVPDTIEFNVAQHTLEEVNSSKGLCWLIDVPFCSRLRNEKGETAALVNVNRAVELVGMKT